jgi:hypothetical protein
VWPAWSYGAGDDGLPGELPRQWCDSPMDVLDSPMNVRWRFQTGERCCRWLRGRGLEEEPVYFARRTDPQDQFSAIAYSD